MGVLHVSRELLVAALVRRLGGEVTVTRQELVKLGGELTEEQLADGNSIKYVHRQNAVTVETTCTKDEPKPLYPPAPEEEY